MMRKAIDQYLNLKSLTRKQVVILFPLLFLLFNFSVAQNNLIEISGQVTDQEKNLPLPDVSIQIKGSFAGTTTDETGKFVLRTKIPLPFTLVFSSIGFQSQE